MALKRITVEQLTPGMYVQRVGGSWMDHPFWRSSFAVRSAADVARLRDARIPDLWIDTERGLDVAPPVVAAPEPAAARDEVERELVLAATAPLPLAASTAEIDGSEFERARALCQHAKETVSSLFAQTRMGRAVDPEACMPLVDEISESVTRDPGAFISLARLKRQDEYTYMHSVAVCALMVGLARQLGLSAAQTREAGLAGMMHDIGKALMPLEVLNKPSSLTADEYRIMQAHPVRGHELLQGGRSVSATVADVCLHHHEKIDGTGYPHKLTDERISLHAKMGAVCDVYDAVTSNRPYKAGWDPGESLRKMAQWKGHFDPRVFQAFVKTVGIYPVGSLVRLHSQRLAVVCEQRSDALLTPRVKAFYSIALQRRIDPVVVDLAAPGSDDKVVSAESPQQWKQLSDLDALWLPATS